MIQVTLLRYTRFLPCLAAAFLFVGCGSSTDTPDDESEATPRGPEWVEPSHGKVDPDTSKAFPAGRRELTISMSDATWNAIVASLAEACGGSGSSSTCTGSTLDDFDSVSAWREADLLADGQKWASVGIRLRSNGELADAWKKGTNRFPFRITMDKWEKEKPAIDNQRFYGFQKLSLASLADDSTGLQHQIAAALYRQQGIPAFRSGIVSLKLVHGSTTLDLGVYSLREMIDGTMLTRWFSGKDGNLYEPSSSLSSFVQGEFQEGENDGTFSDAKAFVSALNAANRTTAPEAWRNALSATFDVDGFVSWLAVSTALGDKGSYGNEAGNYALYSDGGKLRWMALDADNTFPTGNGLQRGVWHAGASTSWPLVANVLADSVLCEKYKARLSALAGSTGPLSASNLSATVRNAADTYLQGLPVAAAARDTLLKFAQTRASVIDTSLSNHSCPAGF